MVIPIPVTYPKEVIINYYHTVQSPLIVGLDATTYTQSTEKYLDKVRPTGVILLGNNINNYDQTKQLISDIHKYAENRGIRVEVMIDEEGGIVSRLKNIENYPSFKGISEYSSKTAKLQAKYLRDIGVDTNLAPVTDIAYKPSSVLNGRCAGNTPEKVSAITSDYINILHEFGIKSTAKHFPGHGRTTNDTHFETATIDITYKEWLKEDSKPFISAISNNTEYLMMGHLVYSKIDNTPASISTHWVDIIRTELGFRGKIMTDDLKMAAVGKGKENTECSIDNNYAHLVRESLDAGINLPMIILSQADTIQTYSDWIEIEKGCE